MRGYAMGCEDAGVIDASRVNHGGMPLGRIIGLQGGMARVAVERALHNGDGLQIRGTRGEWELIYSGPEVSGGGVALLRLRPDIGAQPGDTVVCLADEQQLSEARAMPLPMIPVTMHLKAMPGEPLSLTVTDGISTVTVAGDTVQAARSRALTPEDAARSLTKTGDTAFICTACTA